MKKVVVNDLMQKNYVYYLKEKIGKNFSRDFKPELTPTLDLFKADPAGFNDLEVARRDQMTPQQTLAEYEAHHTRVMSLIEAFPPEKFRLTGIFPWYGSRYDLEDWIAYGFYGHKCEHSAQVNVFRDLLVASGRLPDVAAE